MAGTCANCGGDDLVRIQLAPNGGPLVFATCRRCEHRWWTDVDRDAPVALAHVLGQVSPS